MSLAVTEIHQRAKRAHIHQVPSWKLLDEWDLAEAGGTASHAPGREEGPADDNGWSVAIEVDCGPDRQA
jgi:hypothetical protein